MDMGWRHTMRGRSWAASSVRKVSRMTKGTDDEILFTGGDALTAGDDIFFIRG